MRRNAAILIEQWFTRYRQDGEFLYEGTSSAYTVVGPSKLPGRIVFATKPHIAAAAIEEFRENAPNSACAKIGLIGRYGLPCRFDMAWIRDVVAKHELFFLGDLDPVDLMIFVWLRARLHPKRIEHLGINDDYLHQTRVRLPDSFIMRCSQSERKALPVLRKAFPILSETLGPDCTRILEQGQKIELDAVASALETFSPILSPLIRSRK